jgi:diguanylate cyclase
MNRESLIGKNMCDVLPINREAGFFEKYEQVFDTGVPLEEEFFLPETHVPAAWYYHQVTPTSDGIFVQHNDISRI